MPLEKLVAFTKKVQDLADKPNATMTAAEVKAQFDAAPDEVRVYLNKLITVLESTTDGDSGAENIGATPFSTSPATVQGILEWLKVQIDSTVLGQIPDGSITDVKLSDGPTEIKQRINDHQADDTSHVRYGIATGIDAKTTTLNPTPTALVEGFALSFKNNTANTDAVTLNINALGAKPVVKSNGNTLTSGDLKEGSIYTVRYDGTSFILQGEGGDYGNATASQVLAPNTIGTKDGVVVGTMPNRGTFNVPLGASVPAGYYSGGDVPSGKTKATGNSTAVYESASNKAYITISGIAFTPSIILVKATNAIYGSSNEGFTVHVNKSEFLPVPPANIGAFANGGNNATNPTDTVIGSGFFKIPVFFGNVSGYQVTWIALG